MLPSCLTSNLSWPHGAGKHRPAEWCSNSSAVPSLLVLVLIPFTPINASCGAGNVAKKVLKVCVSVLRLCEMLKIVLWMLINGITDTTFLIPLTHHSNRHHLHVVTKDKTYIILPEQARQCTRVEELLNKWHSLLSSTAASKDWAPYPIPADRGHFHLNVNWREIGFAATH